MDKSSKLIAITHIINPSRFYCRDLSLATKEQEHITKIEKQLEELSEGRTRDSFFYEPKQGDVSTKELNCNLSSLHEETLSERCLFLRGRTQMDSLHCRRERQVLTEACCVLVGCGLRMPNSHQQTSEHL